MSAYVIADVKVIDPERYGEYRRLAEASIREAGGRYLVRGGDTAVLEGAASPNRMVIVEFDDMQAARAWYDGEGYRAARAAHAGAATAIFILVEGVAES